MTDKLSLQISGKIAELIISNPKKRNAFDLEMWAAIPGHVEHAAKAECRVLLLHGGDSGHFAAGADISEFPTRWSTAETASAAIETMARATGAVAGSEMVSIAAIEGACFGAGLSLATACDFRIIADGAQIALPPAKLGASYPFEDLRRLSDIVGLANTRNLILAAKIIDADEAEKIGLASERCPKGEAAERGLELGEELSKLSAWSQGAAKTQLGAIASGQRHETSALRNLQVEGFLNPDFREGYDAFLSKRKPDFSK